MTSKNYSTTITPGYNFGNPMTLNVHFPDKNEVETPKERKKIYGDKWVVLQNKLVYSISDLSLDARRLILFLSPIVRKAISENPEQKSFIVRVDEYAKEYDLKSKRVYDLLKKHSKQLQQSSFVLWLFDEDDKDNYLNSINWAHRVTYKQNKGEIEIYLSDIVIDMLSVLNKDHPFTKFERKLLANLNHYALILLELVASFEQQRNKQKLFTIKYLREKFNCVDKYPQNAEFIRTVLKKASDILRDETKKYSIDFESQALGGGREVTHVLMKINYVTGTTVDADEVKEIVDNPNPLQWDRPLSDKQIAKIAANRDIFVDLNKHLLSKGDNRHYPEIFNEFEKALKDKDLVSTFTGIPAFLQVQRGQDVIEVLKFLNSKK